ncbi:TonB-dependent receptor [Parasphingorhabdus cellanae]|uniref:TonB-dependent receptor n=1 Tax=Parasphingorhabdus cellanae TaxID=2806553 RepID=A0ABX7T3T1_9SPHN|nr:TonB-dependent receptor [Parasphingorhabdus cellanae]
MTVTAIGGDTLEKFQVDQIADVVSRVPALNVQVGGSGSGGQISLRGVGSSNISAAFDSAVAFDFDGVQVSTMRMVQAGFFDVEQIDVLKGPQSLFFGKSASAGVFSIRSANPTPDWEMGVKVSQEFEENGTVIGGYISGPLSDTLGIRLAGQYTNVEDYVELEAGTPAINQSRGLKDFVGRLTLQWEPSDNFNANLKLNYIRNENDGAIAHSDIDCGPNGRADEIVLLGGGIAVPSNASCDTNDGLYPTADPSATLVQQFPDGSPGQGKFKGTPFGETDIIFGRLKWDLDVSDTLTVSSVSGYLNLDAVDFDCYGYVGVGPAFNPGGAPVGAIAPALAAVNTAGSAQGFGCSDPQNATEQFTQELRLASDFDGMFNFMIGAFYESREIDFNTSQQAVNISIVAPDPVTGSTFDYFKKQNTKTEAVSLFSSVTLDFTDQLQLSGGVRWTDETKTSTISVPYVHTFLSATPNFIDSGFFSGPIKFSDSNFSPEVSLRYQATPDINIYGAFKTGFKSGGIDNSALPSSSLLGFDSPDPAVRQAVADSLRFKSETGLGGEIGVKSQFADRSVTLNVSAFYYVFDDLQVQNFDATTVQFETFNASQLTSKGIDVEWAWQTPVEGLNFSGALAYTDAKFTDTFITDPGTDGPGAPGPTGISGEGDPNSPFSADDTNLDGRTAARAPKFAGNIAFDWTMPMSDSLEFGLNGNLLYTGSYFTNEDTLDDLKQDSYVTIDGSVSVGDPDGKWRLSLVGVNLTDEIWINTSGGRPFLAGPGLGLTIGDDQVVTQNRGRQVFLEAAFKF